MHIVYHCIGFISILTSISSKCISKHTLFHAWSYCKVYDSFFIAIIKPCHHRHICSPFQHLQFVYHFGRQVLRRYFWIVAKKLLTIYQYFFNFSTVHGNLTIFVNFNARHFLQQVFNHSTLGYFVRGCIIFHGVAFYNYFCCFGNNYSFI